MQVYFTTPRSSVVEAGRVTPCRQVVCSVVGHTGAHLCFVSEPLAGHGPNVFFVDLPLSELEQYEYKNEFRSESARFFAIPAKRVAELELQQDTFEAVTGRPWNKWTITVLDKREVKGESKLRGKWALIWTSREGIASAKVYRTVPGVFMSVEVQTTADYDPEVDSVIVEKHEEFERPSEHRVKETWKLEQIGGLLPYWAIFPTMWNQWVWNKSVQHAAVQYLLEEFPDLRSMIAAASGRDSKHNKARAWREVSDHISRALMFRLKEKVSLGHLAGHSWTAVTAMPMRIALRVSQNLPYRPWEPPVPKPEFMDPEKSGRYLLANLYGAYPHRGPGVDHAPQDRPYTGREGEELSGS